MAILSDISSNDCHFGGKNLVLNWLGDGELLARRQGLAAWGKTGVLVCPMRAMPVSLYHGDAYSSASGGAPVIAKRPKKTRLHFGHIVLQKIIAKK